MDLEREDSLCQQAIFPPFALQGATTVGASWETIFIFAIEFK